MRHEFDKYQGDAGESLGIKINVREMIYAAIRKFSLMRIKIDAESSYAGQRSLPAIARCSGKAAGNWMLVHQRRIKQYPKEGCVPLAHSSPLTPSKFSIDQSLQNSF